MTDSRLQAQLQNLLGRVQTTTDNLVAHRNEAAKKHLDLAAYIRLISAISEPVQILKLTETLQLEDDDPVIIAADPGGSSRNVITPPPGLANHLFIVINLADAAEDLNVIDKDAAALVTISQDEIGILVSDGDDELGNGWVAIDAVALGGGEAAAGITNLDGGRSDEVYGGVGDSPIDGGDST